jgi:uncharacterized protein (TIRG00374 family)
MRQKIKYIFLAFGLSVFSWMVYDFGLANIWKNIQQTGYWIIPVIGIWFFVYLLNAGALFAIIGPYGNKIGFLKSLQLMISGFAINYTTPFVTIGGEPYRAMELRAYMPMSKAVSSVILYKAIQWLAHFLFWIITIGIFVFAFPLASGMKIALLLIAAGLLVFCLLLLQAHKKGIVEYLYKILAKIPFLEKLQNKLREKEEGIKETDEFIKDLYNNRRRAFYLAVLFEFASRIVSSFEFYFILRSLGMETSVLQAVYINSISSLIMNIFFFVPLELGVREGSLFMIMETLSVNSGLGVFIAIINRIREFFWIFTGLLLIQLTNMKRINYQKNLKEERTT